MLRQKKTARIPRSMSLSCVRTPELKDRVLGDAVEYEDETMPHYFQTMTKYTLILINLEQFPAEFASYLEENIIDVGMKHELENRKIINWCRTVKPLFPLKTRGDGNCLLHAVTLAMWGIHDSSAFLRRLVFVALVSDGQTGGGRFRSRWQRTRARFNKFVIHGGIQFNSQEWESEWQQVIHAADDIKKQSVPNQPMYDFLEDIHIFVLSNILRRPIIILADPIVRSPGGSHIGENHFSGVYLPLLWNPADCVKTPIILGYASSHFSPLIGMEDGPMDNMNKKLIPECAIPLVTKNIENLLLHYLTEREESHGYEIMKKYLDVMDINWTRSDSVQFIPCARLKYKKLEEFDIVKDHVFALERAYRDNLRFGNSKKGSDTVEPMDITEEERYNFLSTEPERQKTVIQKKKKVFDSSLSDTEDKILNVNDDDKTVSLKRRDTEIPIKEDTYPYSAQIEHECKFLNCYNYTTAKTHPYCHAHRRKRSNSASFEDITHLDENMERVIIDEKQGRNSWTGKHGNLNGTSKACQQTGCSMYGLHEWGYMCSQHRNDKRRSLSNERARSPLISDDWQKCRTPNKCSRQGHARYKGQCKNCFIDEDKKMYEVVKCKNPNCEFSGTKEYNNCCSKCVIDFGFLSIEEGASSAAVDPSLKLDISAREKMDIMDILGLIPDLRSPSEIQNARDFYKCQFHNCRQLSTECTLGYCTEHFLALYRIGRLNIPTKEEMVQFKHNFKTRAKSRTGSPKHTEHPVVKYAIIKQQTGTDITTETDKNFSPSNNDVETEKLKMELSCSTPNCTGIRCHNDYNLCYFCFDAFQHGKKMPEVGLNDKNSTDEELIESAAAESGPNGKSSSDCRGPVCNNKGNPMYKGLCQECHSTLSKARAEKMLQNPISPKRVIHPHGRSNVKGPSPPKQLMQKCKSPTCIMYGNQSQKGFCSKCFKAGTIVPGALTEQEKLRQIRLNMMTEAQRMNELPLDRVTNYPRKCISENCDLYGDPVYRGFCSKCAQEKGMLSLQQQQTAVSKIPTENECEAHCRMPVEESLIDDEQMDVQPTIPGGSSSTPDLGTSRYLQAMMQVENQNRSQKCKWRECENYGSSKNQGYCNDCFILYANPKN